MSDNVVTFERPSSFRLSGPFEVFEVLVNDRCIPLLTGKKTDDGRYNFIVDGRFMGGPFSPTEAEQVAFILAQAIAVASGYSDLGAENKDRVFAPVVHHLGELT
jgi:hypothetical protein